MKLLALHLRNIASIEKADIDFEHEPGLMDPDTGQPAQMFLIHGETGTGKSILLDAIAMALYDETPRLEGVADRVRNTYVDSAENEISLNSIEQYTRLGTTPGDECYSEVLFEGNDGVRYRARMELGYNRKMKSHNKWLLQVGDAPEISGKQCGEVIERAVGLNFTQFCRMAMLAQGQFSAFLCGKRKERADILERLTNTAVFSQYGEAITRLHSRKKEAVEKARALMEQAATYILGTDETEQLRQQATTATQAAQEAHARTAKLHETLALLDGIAHHHATLSQAITRLQQLRQEHESEAYKERVATVHDWDATQEQREQLGQLNIHHRRLTEALQASQQTQAEYSLLAADLAWRQQELQRRNDALEAEALWVEQQNERQALYGDAGATGEQLKALHTAMASLEKKKREKERCDTVAPTLAKELAAAVAAKHLADTAAEQARQETARLTAERDALEPGKTARDLDDTNRALLVCNTLSGQLATWKKENEQLREAVAASAAKKQALDEARQTLLDAQAQAQHDADEQQRTLRRYTTLHASLDETLEELRRGLQAGDSDICPLCGQTVGPHLYAHEQFERLLSPLQQERDAAAARAKASLEKADSARQRLGTLEGELKNLGQQVETLTQSVDKNRPNLRLAGIEAEPGDEGSAALAARIALLESQRASLGKQQERVRSLQQSIDQRQTTQRALDEEKTQKGLALQQKQTEVDNNQRQQGDLATEIATLQKELNSQHAVLHSKLAPWRPDWDADPLATATALKTEAEHYAQRVEGLRQHRAQLQNDQATASRMEAAQARLLRNHPQWPAHCEPRLHDAGDPEQAWNSLHEHCSRLQQTVEECREGIGQMVTALDTWYRSSGHDEHYLSQLAARRDIAALRDGINRTVNEIGSCDALAKNAAAAIAQSRQTLGLADDAPLPDRQTLTAEKAATEEAESAALARRSDALSKLRNDEEHRQQYNQRQEELEKLQATYARWDTINRYFGGDRFRNLVQTYILQPSLANANMYLSQITDRYTLTCSEENAQLSILVLDGYNRNEVRSSAVLSGGERFMISLALSLALSSLNRADMNVNILFIDEGFGTLDQECLDSVMKTLGRLSELNGQANRRVGIISHREELLDRIPNKIRLRRSGEGRSSVEIERTL